jgi:hypothetical protein
LHISIRLFNATFVSSSYHILTIKFMLLDSSLNVLFEWQFFFICNSYRSSLLNIMENLCSEGCG